MQEEVEEGHLSLYCPCLYGDIFVFLLYTTFDLFSVETCRRMQLSQNS